MTVDAAQKKRYGILQMNPSCKHYSQSAGSTRNRMGVGGGEDAARGSEWSRHSGRCHPLPRILFVIFAVMLPLLCICGMARRFCCVCRPQQNLGENHQAPPEPPSNARIWVTDLDPPPPYSQVGLSVPMPNLFHGSLSNLLKQWIGEGCQPSLSCLTQARSKPSTHFFPCRLFRSQLAQNHLLPTALRTLLAK